MQKVTTSINNVWLSEFLLNKLHDVGKVRFSSIPSEQDFQGATVARAAAIIQEKEVEAMKAPSPGASSPLSEGSAPEGSNF